MNIRFLLSHFMKWWKSLFSFSWFWIFEWCAHTHSHKQKYTSKYGLRLLPFLRHMYIVYAFQSINGFQTDTWWKQYYPLMLSNQANTVNDIDFTLSSCTAMNHTHNHLEWTVYSQFFTTKTFWNVIVYSVYMCYLLLQLPIEHSLI